jgi:sodium transport system permease protein
VILPRRATIACIYRKELTDAVRDRKSMLTVLLYTLIGPLILIPLLVFIAKPLSGAASEATLRVPTIGVARAPGLVEALRDANIVAEETTLDPAAAVRAGQAEVVLVVSEGYGAALLAGKPAGVRIVADRSRASGAMSIRRVTAVVDGYGRRIGAQRLLARGISPSIGSAIDVQNEEVSTSQERAALLLGSIPMFVLMAMIMGSGFAAVDVTAGERERGSLEPLLANPVTAAEVVLGKLLAVATLGAAATFACVCAFGGVLEAATRLSAADASVAFTLRGTVLILVAVLPLALAIAALEMVLAGTAKTVREANTVVMLLTLVPTVPGMALLFGRVPGWLGHLPVIGEEILVLDTLQGKTVSLVRAVGVAATSTVVAAALARLAVRSHVRALRD